MKIENTSIGGCGKHIGQSMINCPICASDKIKENTNKAKDSADELIRKYKQIQTVSLTDKQATCCAFVGCLEIINVLENNRSVNWSDIINRDKNHWETVKKELANILAP